MLHCQAYIKKCCVMAVLSQASNLGAKQVQHSSRHRHAVPEMFHALPEASRYALQSDRACLHT